MVLWSSFLLFASAIKAASLWQNGTEGRNVTTNSGSLILSVSQHAKTGNATTGLTTGSGLEYASKCNSAKIDWYISRGSSLVSTTTFQTSTPDVLLERSTWFTTTTSLAPGATPYTLCDGYTRIDGTTNFSTSVFVTSSTTFSTFQTATEVYVNVTAPPCLIQSSDCAYLNSSFSKASTAYSNWRWSSIESYLSSQPFTTQPPPSPSEGIAPICGTAPAIRPTSISLIPAVCIVNTAHVQLLYWPVTTATDCDLCDMNHCATRTPSPTIPGAPNTVVTFGTTLTSPTVYIAFEGEMIGNSEGQSFSDVKRFLVPQSSTAISSYCGKIGGGVDGPPQSFNFANLNGPVPASVYRCQPRCFTNHLGIAEYTTTYKTSGRVVTATSVTWSDYPTENLCSTIWNDYDPMLSIPAEVSTMLFSEASSGCNFTAMPEAVLFDPPLALTQADHADKPTAPVGNPAQPTGDPVTPTAKPGGTPDPTTPQPTATPAPEQPSPTGSAVAPPGGDDSNSENPPQESDFQPPGSNNNDPPQTTSRNIGSIIASVIGMTTPSDPPSPGQQTGVTNPPPQSPEPHPTQNGNPPHGTSGNDAAPTTVIPATGLVLTNSKGQELTIVQDPVTQGFVGSTTIAVGHTAILPNVGTVIAHSSGVVFDDTRHAISTVPDVPTQAAGTIIQGSDGQPSTIAQLSNEQVAIGTTTLSAGDTTSVAGVGDVAVQTDAVVIERTTHYFSQLPPAPTSPPRGTITAGTHTFTAGDDGSFTISPGEVFTPGGSVIVSGTIYSLDPSGLIAVVNGSSETISTPGQVITGVLASTEQGTTVASISTDPTLSSDTVASSGSQQSSQPTTAASSISGPTSQESQGSLSSSGAPSEWRRECSSALVWLVLMSIFVS